MTMRRSVLAGLFLAPVVPSATSALRLDPSSYALAPSACGFTCDAEATVSSGGWIDLAPVEAEGTAPVPPFRCPFCGRGHGIGGPDRPTL
jgi:hypothetical protein